MRSCIYEGVVSHCRRRPVTHKFQYRLFMVCLDLDELPQLAGQGRLISTSRHRSRSFLRSDHLYGDGTTLDDEVRSIVRSQTGQTPAGPIRLLTQLRYFGVYFSPLNLFYVYDQSGSRVEYVVAEVNNTPWNERHCYVLWDGNRMEDAAGRMQFAHDKQFHVSPFMPMELQYRWQLSEPGEELAVGLTNLEQSRPLFQATMALQRHELSKRSLRHMVLRYPVMTAKISAAIYYQALKLWWKKCPFFTHPRKKTPSSSRSAGEEPARPLPPTSSTWAAR